MGHTERRPASGFHFSKHEASYRDGREILRANVREENLPFFVSSPRSLRLPLPDLKAILVDVTVSTRFDLRRPYLTRT